MEAAGKGGAGAREGIVTLERAGVMMYRKRGAGREAGAQGWGGRGRRERVGWIGFAGDYRAAVDVAGA